MGRLASHCTHAHFPLDELGSAFLHRSLLEEYKRRENSPNSLPGNLRKPVCKIEGVKDRHERNSSRPRRLILHTEAGYIYADYFSSLSILLAFRRRTIHLHSEPRSW